MRDRNYIVIHTDGGARGNPGPAASAFIVSDDTKEIFKDGKYLSETTNNVAEYTGVILALEWLKINPEKSVGKEIKFFLDSLLVVNQLKGLFKVKDSKLRELILKVRSLENEIGLKISYQAVPREKNKEADLLVNQILDQELSSR